MKLGTPFGYIFITDPKVDSDLSTSISTLACRYRGRIQFSIAAASRVPAIMDDMHVDDSSLPAFAIRDPISNLKYPMPRKSPNTSLSGAVETFIDEFRANKLEPKIKSEAIPPPSSSALIKVVGLTYDSIVNDPTRDVLLTICIEKCGPCHRLYPVLEEVAETYATEESEEKKTTIATVLYDMNDIALRRVRAFPTILLFSAKRKTEPVRFLGERTVERLREFIEAHRIIDEV